MRLERGRDLLGEHRLIEERAGRQNLDHRVDVGVPEQNAQHLIVQVLEMRGGEVDIAGWMADIGGGRQDRLQGRVGLVGERGHLEAGQFGNLVDAHRSRPAHMGEHGDAVALRHRLQRERAQRIVEFRDAAHAHQSELAEGAFVDRLGAGDRAGMGERRGRAQFAAAAFEHHHRLDRGGGARRLKKAARIGQTFEIDADDAGRLIVLQETEQLGHLNVGHVAHGDIFVQAHPAARARGKQKRIAEGAALREHADAAARIGADVEIGVEAAHSIHDADAVRADEPDRGGAQNVDQIFLPLLGLGRVDLAEARRHADRALDVVEALFSLRHFLGDRHGQLGRHHQNAQFDRFGNVAHAFVARQPEDALFARIDRVQFAFVAHGDHVAQRGVARLLRIRRGAHHGDALRIEEHAQRGIVLRRLRRHFARARLLRQHAQLQMA